MRLAAIVGMHAYPTTPTCYADVLSRRRDLGVGSQFVILSLCLLVLGGVGTYYPYNRGAMKTSIVVIYVITSCTPPVHLARHRGSLTLAPVD
jgi:hypothetical protein